MNLHGLQPSDYDIKYQNSDYPGEVGRFPHPRVCLPAVSPVLREVFYYSQQFSSFIRLS